MKKRTLILLICSLVSIHYVYQTYAEQKQPLAHMVDTFTTTKTTLDSWCLTTKSEKITTKTEDEYASLIHRIRQHFRHFTWQQPIKTEHTITYTATNEKTKLNVAEKVNILTHLNKSQQETVISYEMTGKQWDNRKEKDIFANFSTQTSDLFSKSSQIFACITGKMSDTMGIALHEHAEAMLHSLQAEEIERIEEKAFISISAYNKQWNTTLQTQNGKINAQIALRKMKPDGPIHVHIGTPILTAEY